jgi:hypothetical protein
MRNLRIRYIENFPIQEILIKKKSHAFFHFLYNLRFMKQNDFICDLYVCMLKNVVSLNRNLLNWMYIWYGINLLE